ncbi:hypothetical protein BHE74_00041721 [Ensete ventricosum]|nr:hypothetical protein GW17_00020294 [Ensete ventricosum]RWW51892.1 hypothetical protein BHE74_00041721 [Ensete ventricosum]RZR99039.1 hypothetical protein BHM03_00028513 [Ensete ventricosum]
MNRGFRDAAAPGRVVTKEADEELALFLEMRKLEKQRNNLLLHNAGELDPPLGNVDRARRHLISTVSEDWNRRLPKFRLR